MIPMPADFTTSYLSTLSAALAAHAWDDVARLADALEACWRDDRQLFLCGNGGSAANAVHLANDFLYGIDKPNGRGLRVSALPANPAVMNLFGE